VTNGRAAAWVACAALAIVALLAVREIVFVEPRVTSTPAASDDGLDPYPRGRWRLDPASLNDVLLSFEEILVSHREARDSRGLASNQQGRTRGEALVRAKDLASQARAHPETFQALARRHSDDTVNASWGGTAGVVRAPLVQEQLLDALALLEVGEVSRVIATPEGFHVIKRLAVPPDERLAAKRIVIKYRGSQGTPRPGVSVSRTRQEARVAADLLASDLKGNPGAFESAVEQHSEEYDVSGGGYMGTWPLYDGSAWALIFHAIASTPIGAVSDPVESAEGFNILKRTPPVPPARWAVRELVVSYSDAPERSRSRVVPRSKDEARTLAARLAAELSAAPEKMAAAIDRYCDLERCPNSPSLWEPGRNYASLDRVVAALRINEVSSRAVESPMGFHVLRRDDPATLPPAVDEPVTFEVPEPAFKDLAFILEHASNGQLASGARTVASEGVRELKLEGREAKEFSRLFEHLAKTFEEAQVDTRKASFDETDRQVEALLGPDRHRHFHGFLEQWLSKAQLE
jgi:hypothetical protein